MRRLQAVFEHSPDLRAYLLGRLSQGGDVVGRYRITFGKKTVSCSSIVSRRVVSRACGSFGRTPLRSPRSGRFRRRAA